MKLGVFKDLKELFEENVSEVIRKVRDPVAYAKRQLDVLGKAIVEIEDKTASINGQLTGAERNLKALKDRKAELDRQVNAALDAGNDDDALLAQARYDEFVNGDYKAAEDLYVLAKENSDEMVEYYNKFLADFKLCQAQIGSIETKSAILKSKKLINKTAAEFNGTPGGMSKMDGLKSDLQAQLDKEDARTALRKQTSKDKYFELDQKYGSAAPASAADSLAARKAARAATNKSIQGEGE